MVHGPSDDQQEADNLILLSCLLTFVNVTVLHGVDGGSSLFQTAVGLAGYVGLI